jgi:acyl-CoA hydrolase
MVTVSIDKCNFEKPARESQLLKIYGKPHRVGNTSVSLYMEARAHNVYTGAQTLVLKTNITFVHIDEEGNPINPTPGKNKKIVPIKESSTSVTAGPYTGPIELGLKKWKKQHLGPFQEFVDTEINHKKKQKTMKNNIKTTISVWEKNSDGTYDSYEHDVHTVNEDLAVWFGTKKKPKGSKQPKGPWVNICRKVDGKHPPCGRPEGGSKGYPKCRAVGVAGKMSDSAKKAACQQKRRAEKKDTQTGKGQKPVMTSYKPKNENIKPRIVNLTESDLKRIINRVLKEDINPTN